MKALDLFCGAGGITRGFLESGFRVKGIDNSDSVEATFELNNHAEFERKNLFRDTVKQDCDVITGGPPCKPWSSVNVLRDKRGANHMDHTLVSRFFAHIEQNRPSAFLFENVPPLQYDPILRRHIARMEKLHYSVKDEIVKYSDYGAATSRKRLIVFGTRVGKADTFFHMLESKKRPAATVKEKIWELRRMNNGEIPDHEWPDLKTIHKYKKYYRTHKYGWYILEWNKPAPSFGNVMKTYILHPYGFKKPPRVISVKEAMLIMGFSMDFHFPAEIGMGEKYQMTVDSVSPVFSRVAGSVIKDILNGKGEE
jgi:DNA (cytosine-5)-methyltransferase 1